MKHYKREACGCEGCIGERTEINSLIKKLGDIFSKIFNSEEPYQGEYDKEKQDILKRLEKITGKTI